MIVDVHSHVLPGRTGSGGPREQLQSNLDHFLRLHEESTVDFSVLSQPMVVHSHLGDGPEALLELTRRTNDFTAELVARRPDQFAALAAIYPQGGDAFLREFERAVGALGMRGAMVCPRHGDLFLDSPEADEFLALACQLDVPIYFHPPFVTFAHDALPDCRLDETLGRGMETTVALARLIMHGVFDRYPRLKIVGAHGGGALTALLGRLEYSWEIREQPSYGLGPAGLTALPSSYARRIWVDTVVFWRPALRAVLDTHGVDKVMLGTDTPPLPFPLSRSVEAVDELELSSDARAAILGGNAVALFRLPTPARA